MMDEYPIIEVPPEAAERNEPMGSKHKFWFGEPGRLRRLFKYGRPNHGEDWAEKIAAEVADLLGIPHAEIELATCAGKPGTVSTEFCRPGDVLIHGNELMVDLLDPTYPFGGSKMLVKQHTVPNAMKVLELTMVGPPEGLRPVSGIVDGVDAFVGYLLLDALIGNTDRHHENWAIIVVDGPGGVDSNLAPTFDHASSLGRELTDEKRLARLDGKDPKCTVERYLSRAQGRFFASETDARPLPPFDAFRLAAQLRPAAASAWLAALREAAWESIEEVVRRVPALRMSAAARRFALRMIELNGRALLG